MANEDKMIRDMMRGMVGVLGMAVMIPAVTSLLQPGQPPPQPVPLSIEIIPGTLAQAAQQALGISPQEISPTGLTEWSVGNIIRMYITNSTYKGTPTSHVYIPYTFGITLYSTCQLPAGNAQLASIGGSVYTPAAQPAAATPDGPVTVDSFTLAPSGIATLGVTVAAGKKQSVDVLFDIPLGMTSNFFAQAQLWYIDTSHNLGNIATSAVMPVSALPVTVGGGITF